MNKFLSLLTFCMVLALANAGYSYNTLITIKSIDGTDGQEVKGNFKFTFHERKTGKTFVATSKDLTLKVDETLTLPDTIAVDLDVDEAATVDVEWNLSESDAAKFASKTPTISLGGISFYHIGAMYGTHFGPNEKIDHLAPGETAELFWR